MTDYIIWSMTIQKALWGFFFRHGDLPASHRPALRCHCLPVIRLPNQGPAAEFHRLIRQKSVGILEGYSEDGWLVGRCFLAPEQTGQTLRSQVDRIQPLIGELVGPVLACSAFQSFAGTLRQHQRRDVSFWSFQPCLHPVRRLLSVLQLEPPFFLVLVSLTWVVVVQDASMRAPRGKRDQHYNITRCF